MEDNRCWELNNEHLPEQKMEQTNDLPRQKEKVYNKKSAKYTTDFQLSCHLQSFRLKVGLLAGWMLAYLCVLYSIQLCSLNGARGDAC